MRVLAGRYELVAFVGRGGMGEVWRGRDRILGRPVAVKLLPHDHRDATSAELFFREARTAGGLSHPGVVIVHDLGQDDTDGSLFLVMEFLEGRNVASLLRDDGPPPVATAVGWAAQTAAALAYAHDAGIVHRDLKPANLMLTTGGQVKILDFGIARFLESTNRSSKVMGTLAYMPPERFDEHPGDARSDLYSFGCVLHELLTGKVPFEATGPIAMMTAHLRRHPDPPGGHRPGVPVALDHLVLHLLAKNPGDRPATAGEVHERLLAVGRALTGPSAATHARGRTAAAQPVPAGATPDDTVVSAIPLESAAPPVAAEPSGAVGAHSGPNAIPGPRSGDIRDTPVGSPSVETGRPDPPVRRSTNGTAHERRRPGRRRFLWLATGAVAATAAGVTATLTLPGGDGDGGGGGGGKGGAKTAPGTMRWTHAIGGGVTTAPAVADGVVYVGSEDFHVHAIDAATRTEKWAFKTDSGIASSPVVANGVVYVGSQDLNVYAIDAAGEKKWSYATGNRVGSWPVVVDGIVYVGSDDGNVYAIDAATGDKKWACRTGSRVTSAAAVADGVVYVGSVDDNLYAIDAATGDKKWTYPTDGGVTSPPAVANGVVYIGSDDNHLYAIDAATGGKKWKHGIGGSILSQTVAGDTVYVGSYDGNVYAIDAATGTRKWFSRTGGRVTAAPAVADGIVYVGSHDSHVYAIDAATGAGKWSFRTGGLITSSPVVVGDVLYVVSVDGGLYALNAGG